MVMTANGPISADIERMMDTAVQRSRLGGGIL